MDSIKKKPKYGEPVRRIQVPKPTKRLPQYDECLKEFLESSSELWKVRFDALPSKDIRVVISALKWRINHRPEFKNIRIFMRNNQIYLEKIAILKIKSKNSDNKC